MDLIDSLDRTQNTISVLRLSLEPSYSRSPRSCVEKSGIMGIFNVIFIPRPISISYN